MTATPAWPRYTWTLYVHADPFPALAGAWQRPERLECSSPPSRWVPVKITGGAQSKGQVALDVADSLVKLAGITGDPSGDGAILTVDVGAEQYEVELPDGAHLADVRTRLADLP